jgi:hypothetical protein
VLDTRSRLRASRLDVFRSTLRFAFVEVAFPSAAPICNGKYRSSLQSVRPAKWDADHPSISRHLYARRNF